MQERICNIVLRVECGRLLSFDDLLIFKHYVSPSETLKTKTPFKHGLPKVNWAAVHVYLKVLCNHGPLYKPFYCSLAKVLAHLNTRVCHLRFPPSLFNTTALNLPFHSSGGHSALRLPLWLIHWAECTLAHLDMELNIFKWGDPFF